MRSHKTASFVFILALFGLGTTAKSATLENTLSAIHKNYQPESINDLEKTQQDEIICLALDQYAEARGSTTADIMAVGFSTRNRVTKGSHSFCKTIWEKGQYIWTRKPVKGILPKENASWLRMVNYAKQIVTQDDLDDPTHGADSFYIKRLRPAWARRSPIHLMIGAHIYVRLLGAS